MKKRQTASSFSFPINAKLLRLPSLCLIIGFIVGGHFFDEPPPVIYQSPEGIQIQACFTPQQQCLPLILNEIKRAKKEILVQAYQLTSKRIADALIEARQRGVIIKVLADKSQEFTSHSQLPFLIEAGIEVLVDFRPHIAHNKIILIDKKSLVGGSYNYSDSAEKSNTENVLILKNTPILQEYRKNWLERHKLSRPIKEKGLLP